MFLQYWSVKFKYSINSFIFLTVRNKNGRFGGRGSNKNKTTEAVFQTKSSFFDVAGSRSLSFNINISFSHYSQWESEDFSHIFAHLRQ